MDWVVQAGQTSFQVELDVISSGESSINCSYGIVMGLEKIVV